MHISADRIKRVLGIEVPDTTSFAVLGPLDSSVPGTLSYLADERYLPELQKNVDIAAVFVTENLAVLSDRQTIVVDDPVWAFWTLFNDLALERKAVVMAPSVIHPTVRVHDRAYVSPVGVSIGEGSAVDANATIHEGVTIGRNCHIRSGAVVGFDGFERRRTSRGIVEVVHDGMVLIGDDVEIGTLNSIARGFSWRQTIVGSGTKCDSLVHIAHGVSIGRECFLTACTEISGSVSIGDRCWLGPNCSLKNGIVLGDDVYVGIGAVVLKSFPDKVVLAGVPARILRENV